MDIEAAVLKAESLMDEVDGVLGVAQGSRDGRPVIDVFVRTREVGEQLPATWEGFPVRVSVAGGFTAQ